MATTAKLAFVLQVGLAASSAAGQDPAQPLPFAVEATELVLGTSDFPFAVLRLELTEPLQERTVVFVKYEPPGPLRPDRVLPEPRDPEPPVSEPLDEAKLLEALSKLGYVDERSNPETFSRDLEFELVEGRTSLDLPVPMPVGDERLRATVVLWDGERWYEKQVEYARPDTGWVLYFVPGFHYDPVWWNTQAHYTETGRYMDSHVGPGLELVEAYLAACAEDPDYAVALHQLPYLKTFFEARPEQASLLVDYVARGRVGAVGGTYNELSSTLVSAEAVARNAIYGTLFQREIVGGSADTFWQCDVFGHDPSFPSLMARVGHRNGAFARGPFHQWGAPREQVNFPSEFLWMAPDGEAVLTHYMTGHYGYAYGRFANGSNRASDDVATTNAIVRAMFEDLKRPALTHHVLLPMHMDFVRPLENLGDVVRAWNAIYVSPRAVIGTGEEFFEAVRDEIAERGIVPSVITRDMNPIYTGCGVSFADLKLANRACETTLREAEITATIAWVHGAEYPSRGLDRAWRQLLFNAHHDAVTGSMSDQVYLDVMAGYRDALEIATEVRDRAQDYLGSRVNAPHADALVWNATERERDDWVETEHARADRGTDGAPEETAASAYERGESIWIEMRDEKGAHQGWWGPAQSIDSRVFARRVPALGYAPLELAGGKSGGNLWSLENEYLSLRIETARGGALASLVVKATDRELLSGPANDLVLLAEYPVLPGHGEGPWHLAPTGERKPGTDVIATVLRGGPYRIVLEADYDTFSKRQVIQLLPGSKQVDFETTIVDWKGRDQLLRVEFPLDLPGARPVFQTAAAVIGRPFARDVDTAQDAWTLDQTCWQWAGLGAVATLEMTSGDAVVHRRALGVGEIVLGAETPAERLRQANRLAAALVACGVTTTITREDERRYGDLTFDSNAPDFRVLYGERSEHALLRGHAERAEIAPGVSCAWVEDIDVGLLLLEPAEGLEAVLADLANDQRIRVPLVHTRTLEELGLARELDEPGGARPSRYQSVPDYGVALVNRGPVSMHVSAAGVLGLNLLRSSASWPSGTWIDPPARRLPDGAPFGTMHGSHTFRYSLLVHAGDFRDAALNARAQEVQHPLVARGTRKVARAVHDGARDDERDAPAAADAPDGARPSEDAAGRVRDLPASAGFLAVEPAGVLVTALKPAGFPDARWRIGTNAVGEHVKLGAAKGSSRIVLRLWNGTGRAVDARVLFGELALAFAPARAWRADLLEVEREELVLADGALVVPLAANAYETVILEGAARQRDPHAPSLDPTRGGVSPSAYWLENRGEGVTGNGVASIVPAAREVALVDGAATVELTLVNSDRVSSAVFALQVSAADGLAVALEPARVELAPASTGTATLCLRANGSAPRERSLVTIRARHPSAPGDTTLTAAVWVEGEKGAVAADSPASAVSIENLGAIASAPGELRALVRNHTPGPIPATLRWLAPLSSWEAIPEWTHEVLLPAHGALEVATALGSADDGWAMLEVLYGGEVAYGETVAVVNDPEKVLLAFEVDRVRLKDGAPSRVQVRARSLAGLEADARVELACPPGLRAREIARSFATDGNRAAGVQLLVVEYEVEADSAGGGKARPARGSLRVLGPRGTAASAAYTIAPEQRARPRLGEVEVDGDLVEWDEAEFTHAAGELGALRAAVRFGAGGLALAFAVEDDVFRQPHANGSLWEGDSVQFALSAVPATGFGYGSRDLEFGLARTPSGPLVWCWYGGEGGRTGRLDEVELAVSVAGGTTVYEARIPRALLPGLALEPGAVLGFAYIANDDDGAGYRGATQWAGGMAGGKDASLFGELVLER